MPAPEFSFGMTLTGEAAGATPVFVDVFKCVMAYVGVNGEAGERMLDEIMAERRKTGADVCALHFTAHAGTIEISLSQDGRSFRTSCPVPIT